MHLVISDLYATYKSRVSFLSLVYSAADTIAVLQAFVGDHPTSWNIGRDLDIAFIMNIHFTPTMLVLDKSGNELNRWEGSQSYNTIAASLDQLPQDDDVSVTSLTNTGYIEQYEENKTLIEIITESPITQAVVIIFIVVLIYKKLISPKS